MEESSKLLDAERDENYKHIETCFKEKIEETLTEIKQLERIVDILQNACEYNKKAIELFKLLVTELVIKEISEMRVVSKREKGIFSVTIGKLISEIYTCVSNPENQKNRVKITDPFMLLCHDKEYKESDADIEIALPISGKISVEDPKMEIRTLPALRMSLLYVWDLIMRLNSYIIVSSHLQKKTTWSFLIKSRTYAVIRKSNGEVTDCNRPK